jgi:hypothetical protein
MSVSFIVDSDTPRTSKVEPCLCAQMSPAWSDIFHGESDDWASLRADADPSCARCAGSGAERVEYDERPQVNLANENAAIVASALGIDLDGGIGSMELATLRRGLVRARNVAVPAEFRAGIAKGRLIMAGFSRDDLTAVLARLDGLVRDAQRLGATRIVWQ